MATEETAFVRDLRLRAQGLRELIRDARGDFAPDHVGRWLLHRPLAPDENEIGEIIELLEPLAKTAGERLHQAGIKPEYGEDVREHRLSKRECEYVINLAVLLAGLCVARRTTGMPELALQAGLEGLAWCRVAGDLRQQSILQCALGSVYQEMGRLEEEEHMVRRAVESARASGSSEELVGALNELCGLLVVRRRLEEAEVFNEESLGLMRKELTDEERSWHYPALLMNRGRIQLYRTQHSEGIRTLREALRWADGERNPVGRAAILSHLGSIYLRLEQFRQCIECQHEVIQLAESAGAGMARGWGYYRLAEAHLRLNELEEAAQMLDHADDSPVIPNKSLKLSTTARRAQLLAARMQYDEAVELCRWMLEAIGTMPYPDQEVFAHVTLAEIEERRGRDTVAAEHYRVAIGIADRMFASRSPVIRISLAHLLHRLDRDEEAEELLAVAGTSDVLNLAEQAKTLRLKALIAERRSDLRSVVELEREAFALERSVFERQTEQSLRNARVVAEIDMLERDAELERERRRRVERELADTVVELGDRRRMVESVQQRLRTELGRAVTDQERSMVRVLRETLASLRGGTQAQETPLHYLYGIDQEFFTRLRDRYPDLTPKQERLCGLIRAGLSSREIQALMGLEAEGLKTQRKRLRKRLGLETEDSLEKTLGEI